MILLQTDAETFASWGVDYVKLDGCYSEPKDMDTGYPEFGMYPASCSCISMCITASYCLSLYCRNVSEQDQQADGLQLQLARLSNW